MTAAVEGVGSVPFTLSGLPELPGSAQDCLKGLLSFNVSQIDESISIAQEMNGSADASGMINQMNSLRQKIAAQLQQLQDGGTLTWGGRSMSQTGLDLSARMVYVAGLGLRKALGLSTSFAAADFHTSKTMEEWHNWHRQAKEQLEDVQDGMKSVYSQAETMANAASGVDTLLNLYNAATGRSQESNLADDVRKYLDYAQPLFEWLNSQFTNCMLRSSLAAQGQRQHLDQMQVRINKLNDVISGMQLGILLVEDEGAQQMLNQFGISNLLNNMSDLRQEVQNWHDRASDSGDGNGGDSGGGGDNFGGDANVAGTTWSVRKEFMWRNSAGRVDQWWFNCTMTLNENESVGGGCRIDTYAMDGNNIFMIKTYSADNINRYFGTVSGGSMSGTWEGYWSCTGPKATLQCWDYKWSAPSYKPAAKWGRKNGPILRLIDQPAPVIRPGLA